MKQKFEITENQIQELAGRLNALVTQGAANAQHVAGMMAVLEQVASQPVADNVVPPQEGQQ